MTEKIYKDFGQWWFCAGGMIHGMWKRREYSGIRDLALTLPKSAWDARQPEVDQLNQKLECAETMAKEGVTYYKMQLDFAKRLERANELLVNVAENLSNGIRPGGGKPTELVLIEEYLKRYAI